MRELRKWVALILLDFALTLDTDEVLAWVDLLREVQGAHAR